MYKVLLIDWGDRTTEIDFGLDIAGALETAREKSIEGNTDYALVFVNSLPQVKFEDGEQVT